MVVIGQERAFFRIATATGEVMPLHHYVGWFIVLIVPFALSVLFISETLKGRHQTWMAPLTPIAVLISGVATYVPVSRCVDSYETIVAAKKMLTSTELETLRGTWFCPIAYGFQRDGRKECISIFDGKVGIGCG